MQADLIGNALIAAAAAADVCLCGVLIIKKRVRGYPAVFFVVVLDLISSPLFYVAKRFASPLTYGRFYLAFAALSFLVQLWILYEVAKNVLKPTGIWNRAALKPLTIVGIAGALFALLAAFLLRGYGIGGSAVNQVRADIFTGLLTSELVIAMMVSAGQTGLGWRNHVMAIGQGLMFWSLVTSAIEGIALYLGPRNAYLNLFYLVRVFAYLGVVSYWCVSLWRTEPARKPISPALRKYVLALHESVHYDLGKVGH